MGTNYVSFNYAVCNEKMTEFRKIDSKALLKHNELVRVHNNDEKLLDTDIWQRLKSRKEYSIKVLEDQIKQYQNAVEDFKQFEKQNEEILKYNGFFPERNRRRHNDVFEKAKSLQLKIKLLEITESQKKSRLVDIENRYSPSPNTYWYNDCRDEIIKELERRYHYEYRSYLHETRRKYVSIVNLIHDWENEFIGTEYYRYRYFIADLRINYVQPNICQIHCRRIRYNNYEEWNQEWNPFYFSDYNETVINREIRVFE